MSIYTIDSTEGTLLFLYKQKQIEAGFRDDVHSYDELKYVRVLAGVGVWRIGARDYTVCEGDILILSRADIRQVQEVRESPFSIEQVDFVPAFLSPLQDVADFFIRRPAGFENLLPRDAELTAKLDALVDEVQSDRPYKRQAVRSKLTELVIETARLLHAAPSTETAEDQQSVIEEAMSYIRAHLTEPLTLSGVAKEFFLSTAYFSRLFRRHSGMTFGEYLARVRVGEVLSLISSRPINILDAALACGFRTSSGFYRTFHHVTGATPKQFK